MVRLTLIPDHLQSLSSRFGFGTKPSDSKVPDLDICGM